MKRKVIWILLVMGGFIFTLPGKAQNILTCDMKKRFSRNSVLELKDDTQNIVAKIYRKNRLEFIDCNDNRYIIKKSWNKSFIFYNEVSEDTIGKLTRNRIQLKNDLDYVVRTGRLGLKIKEGNDILLKGSYNPDFRYYHIEIQTPVYHENLINLLAVYYAVRKCREISRNKNFNNVWQVAN